MTTDPKAWENIADNTPETGDEARERITHALGTDPFVRMLSPEIRECMVEAFAMTLIYDRPYPNSVVSGSHGAINRQAKQALDAMPLGFLTDKFKEHVQHLIAFALRPKPDYDDWHRPV